MAKFNPDVPEGNTPSFLGYSQGTPGNLSAGTAFKGVGDVLSSGLTAADTFVKAVIDKNIYDSVNKERDQQTQALEDVVGIPSDQRLTPPGQPVTYGLSPADANPNTPNIIPGSVAAPVPEGLQSGLTQAATYGSMANSAKAGLGNYYIGRLATLASDLRDRYPGYQEFIDAKIERASGIPGANAYVKNLQQILAENMGKSLTLKEKAMGIVGHPDVQDMPGIQNVIRNIDTGNIPQGMSPDGYALLATNDWRSKKAAAERRALMRNDQKGSDDEKSKTANEDFIKDGQGIINSSLVNVFGGDITFNQFSALVGGIQRGEISTSDKDANELLSQAQVYRSLLKVQLTQHANKSVNGEKSLAQQLGPDGVNKSIEAQLAPIDEIIKNVGDKDFGAASRNLRATKNGTSDDAAALYNSADISVQRYIRAQAAIVQLHGVNASNQLAMDALADNLPSHLKTAVEGLKMDIVTGKRTLTQAIQGLKDGKVGFGDSTDARRDRGAYEVTTNITSKISDPTVPDSMKKAILEGSYGTANDELLSHFATDSYDAKGNLIPGRFSLFAKMTSPATTQAVKELSKQPGNERAWENYTGWASRAHAALFGQTAKDLNNIASDPNVNFFYDNKTNTVGMTLNQKFWDTTGQMLGNDSKAALLSQYRQKLAFMNQGLSSMKTIAEAQGTDPNAYLFNIMAAEGIRPDRVTNMGKIMGAVQNSAPPKENAPEGSVKPMGDGLSAIGRAIKGAKDYYNKKADEPWAGLNFQPKEAAKEDIVGSANAARRGALWGDPSAPDFKDKHTTLIQTGTGADVRVNRLAAPAFQGFLKDLEDSGYKINEISGYSYRGKRGGGGISQHAFGNAIDINPSQNQWRSTKNNLPPNVADMAAKWGLTWGGNWKSVKDPMHFEYTGKKLSVADANGNPEQ